MSDTPDTDVAQIREAETRWSVGPLAWPLVPADFARGLERQRDELAAALLEATTTIEALTEDVRTFAPRYPHAVLVGKLRAILARLHCPDHAACRDQTVRDLRAEVERLRESADTAIGYLKDIGDWAHGRSAGPTIQDDMWTIRRMAYEGMDAAAIDAAREGS